MHLEIVDEALFRISEDEVNIARHGDARRDIDAGVEHPEECSELRILNDGKGAVVASDLECELGTEAGGAVSDARCKLGHLALL